MRLTEVQVLATLPFVIPTEAGFPATLHRTLPRVLLSVRKAA